MKGEQREESRKRESLAVGSSKTPSSDGKSKENGCVIVGPGVRTMLGKPPEAEEREREANKIRG